MLTLSMRAFLCVVSVAVALASANAQPVTVECESTASFTREEIEKKIEIHQEWVKSNQLTDTGESELPQKFVNDRARGNFKCVDFTGLNLDLTNAVLSHAILVRANLRGQNLSGITLYRADLTGADLSGAKLRDANLAYSRIYQTLLPGTDLANARLWGAIYQPSFQRGVPNNYQYAIGLWNVQHHDSPAALIALRDHFKTEGLRQQERQITYSIEARKTVLLLTSKATGFHRLFDWMTGVARYIGWECITKYDLEPRRALFLLAGSILVFAAPYYLAMWLRGNSQIWSVLPKDRLCGNGEDVMKPVHATGIGRVRYALQFSLYSAFQLGWRDLNVGTWLSRLQTKEYLLRGSGWVRTLSGIQSLLSLYLLALWALTQFGRLFEG